MTVKRIGAPLIVGLATLAFGATSAAAAVPSPGWTLDSVPTPTNFFSSASEDAECEARLRGLAEVDPCDGYEVTAANAGSEPTTGPVTLTDTLPPGLTVQQVKLELVKNGNTVNSSNGIGGSTNLVGVCPTTVPVQCTYSKALAPDDWLLMRVLVTVNAPVAQGTRLTNRAEVSGGGAPAVSAKSENEVSQAPAPFGPSRFEFFKDGLNGTAETQAGAHP